MDEGDSRPRLFAVRRQRQSRETTGISQAQLHRKDRRCVGACVAGVRRYHVRSWRSGEGVQAKDDTVQLFGKPGGTGTSTGTLSTQSPLKVIAKSRDRQWIKIVWGRMRIGCMRRMLIVPIRLIDQLPVRRQ